MGLRFRKQLRLGKLLRVNFSASGISVGIGPRGANINIGPRGVKKTLGLPGTGIYYQDSTGWNSPTVPKAYGTGSESMPAETQHPWRWIIIIGSAILAAIWLGVSDSGRHSSVSNTTNRAPPNKTASVAQQDIKAGGAITAERPTETAPRKSEPLTDIVESLLRQDLPSMKRDQMRRLQDALRSAGYDPGPSDGILGSRTKAAVQKFREKAAGQPNN